MLRKLFSGLFLIKFTLASTKEAELPLCPTNVLYFPQNLPMHCRMPSKADLSGISGLPPTVPPFYQVPPSDKLQSQPYSIPFPPGVPGPLQMPGPMAFPGAMPMPGPMPMSGPIPIPGPMPMPGAMAMPAPMAIPGPSGPITFAGPMSLPPGPTHKLPVIVMPFYSPDPSFKKSESSNHPKHSFRPRRKIRHRRRRPLMNNSPDASGSTDIETSSDASTSSSEYEGWWKGRKNYRRFNGPIRMKNRRRNQKRQLLTPVLQYVTKDGYVIFEKKISKNEAKDWLNVKKQEKADMESIEQHDTPAGEKEMVTEDNVEVITKRTARRHNRMKAHKNKEAKRLFEQQP